MYQYALRFIETDYPQLIALATMLGVIYVVNETIECPGGSWVDIGYKYVDEENILKDANGVPYVHVNVRTPINVREAAEALAISNPEIAGALSQIPRFFVTDAEGNATLPEYPFVVFA